MSFGRLKTRVKALINRKDFTDELAGDFILDAISILERDLRIGPMETVFEKHDWDGTRNVFPIPANYLELIRMFDDSKTYDEVELETFLRTDGSSLVDRGMYTRVADRWLVKPTPAPGKYVYLHFYGETLRPSVDSDTTVWTEAGFQATLYTAAEQAADFFQMEPDQVARYAKKANDGLESIAGQALAEAWSGRLTIPAPSGVGPY